MTHREVLAALDPGLRATLHQRRNAPGLWHLAGHLGLLALTGAGILAGGPLWWLLLLPHGLLLAFLFTLQHECTHDTPFHSRWLCRAAGHMAGAVLMQPLTWFRHFHLAHHRYTNDPDNDPELAGGGRPATRRAWAVHVSGLPTLLAWATGLVRLAVRPAPAPYLPPRTLPRIRWEARALLALHLALWLTLPAAMLWLWAVPMLLGQPFLRLYLLAEHGACPPVADMLENTRTTHTGRALRWLAWNMPYHIEHHSAPNVPYHQLPQLHAHMAAHLRTTSPSYRAFTRDYLARLD